MGIHGQRSRQSRPQLHDGFGCKMWSFRFDPGRFTPQFPISSHMLPVQGNSHIKIIRRYAWFVFWTQWIGKILTFLRMIRYVIPVCILFALSPVTIAFYWPEPATRRRGGTGSPNAGRRYALKSQKPVQRPFELRIPT